jgi:hypothetical protein
VAAGESARKRTLPEIVDQAGWERGRLARLAPGRVHLPAGSAGVSPAGSAAVSSPLGARASRPLSPWEGSSPRWERGRLARLAPGRVQSRLWERGRVLPAGSAGVSFASPRTNPLGCRARAWLVESGSGRGRPRSQRFISPLGARQRPPRWERWRVFRVTPDESSRLPCRALLVESGSGRGRPRSQGFDLDYLWTAARLQHLGTPVTGPWPGRTDTRTPR